MKYQHRFLVQAPLSQVAAFHRRAASMAAITPAPIVVWQHRTPEILAEGDEMDFTMWMGFVPVDWVARIEAVSSTGFTDRQLRGPFKEWVHTHIFTAVDEQITEVVDKITLRLCPHPLWWVVGLGMRIGLPVLFAYRAWKTKRILK